MNSIRALTTLFVIAIISLAPGSTHGAPPYSGKPETILTGIPFAGFHAPMKRVQLLLRDNELIWVEDSTAPIKKISLKDGTVTELVKWMGPPSDLAFHEEGIIWIENSLFDYDDEISCGYGHRKLNKTSLDGKTTQRLAYGCIGYQWTDFFVNNESNVYWINCADDVHYTIEEIPISGGSISTLVTEDLSIIALAIDETHLYWATRDIAANPSYRIKRKPLAGGEEELLLATNLFEDNTILVVSGSRLIFATAEDNARAYSIYSIPVSGGRPKRLARRGARPAAEQVWVTKIAVHHGQLYWSDTNSIRTVPLTGGQTTVLASRLDRPADLTLDSGRIFWIQHGDKDESRYLMMMPEKGGTPVAKADNIGLSTHMTIKENRAYLSNGFFHSITKIPGAPQIFEVDIKTSEKKLFLSGIYYIGTPITCDDTYLYIRDSTVLKRIGLDGGPLEVLSTSQGGDHNDKIILYNNSLYYGNYILYEHTPPDWDIVKLKLNINIEDFLIHKRIIYYTHTSSDNDTPYGYNILSIPIDNNNKHLLYSSEFEITSLINDDRFLYFFDYALERVISIPMNGGGEGTPLNLGHIKSWNTLSYDDEYVYGLTKFYLSSHRKSDGQSTPDIAGFLLPSMTDLPNALVTGPPGLFWTTSGTGTIWGYVNRDCPPNLRTYKPVEWAEKVPVSSRKGKQSKPTALYDTSPVYVSLAVANKGCTACSDASTLKLLLDGTPVKQWRIRALDTDEVFTIEDAPIGTLPPGNHELTVSVDAASSVEESNEGDNITTRTITVLSR